jgi:cation-transporting P-type ATPase E
VIGERVTTRVAPPRGLSAEEVRARRLAGQANVVTARSSRTALEIVRANVLTRFNAIIATLLAVVLVFGPIQDGLFGLVIVVNSAIGIVQELRAKRTLDALTLLEQVPVRARRDGAVTSARAEDIVVDDLIELGSGTRIPVDGRLVTAVELEVDESVLTGEADPVVKPGAPRGRDNRPCRHVRRAGTVEPSHSMEVRR